MHRYRCGDGIITFYYLIFQPFCWMICKQTSIASPKYRDHHITSRIWICHDHSISEVSPSSRYFNIEFLSMDDIQFTINKNVLHLLFGGIFCKVGHTQLFCGLCTDLVQFQEHASWCVVLLEPSCNDCQIFIRDTAQNISHVYKAIKIWVLGFWVDSGCQPPTSFQMSFHGMLTF